MPEQTPRPDFQHTAATPARSESGLFVPQIITPVPAPRPWEFQEQPKREDTIPPLSEIASRVKSGKNATMKPPPQPVAAERRKSSDLASEPRASRSSSGAAETILVLSGGSSASENGPHRATRRHEQRRDPHLMPSQPKQPKDHGAANAEAAAETDTRPAAKKPKKAQEKKGNGKKQKGKEKGKGEEEEKVADVVGNRPEPATVATRSEYALPQRFANSVKPRSAKYIGAPSLAQSVEDLRRRQVTSIVPPPNPVLQRPVPAAATTTTTTSNTVPGAKGCYRGQDRPAIPSSSQSRASRFPVRAAHDKPKQDVYDIEAYTPPPDAHTRKQQQQQQARQPSASLPFSGTHIHFGEDGDVVEIGPSTVVAAGPGSQASSSTLSAQSAASQQTVENDEPSSSRPGSSSAQRKRRHSTATRCDSAMRPSSAAASLASSEPSHEGWHDGSSSPAKRRKGHHGKNNRRNSTAAPSPSPAGPSSTPQEHGGGEQRKPRNNNNNASRRDSATRLSSAPRSSERLLTPVEWNREPSPVNLPRRYRSMMAIPRTYSPVPSFVSSPNRELPPRNQERPTSGLARQSSMSTHPPPFLCPFFVSYLAVFHGDAKSGAERRTAINQTRITGNICYKKAKRRRRDAQE
ncbi:uncharacterized protein PG986_014095 [Apiospora aurea]|uniref:Proteophosphoglycan ppg4 n=1 Tax=Apiospora aurea TaxID=335848 RepID=A0ABR1PSB0_9PEZI